ncbi:piwi-like protein Siwi [Harpegnathos saltator]|uniref:piwi-like protein Siwi n=1 Tax=Harpegnathos saltator TaxID=610380 RepID=UPI000DBEE93A|nr:piwi-like protein Siwi [Harpegnathos saltator]
MSNPIQNIPQGIPQYQNVPQYIPQGALPYGYHPNPMLGYATNTIGHNIQPIDGRIHYVSYHYEMPQDTYCCVQIPTRPEYSTHTVFCPVVDLHLQQQYQINRFEGLACDGQFTVYTYPGYSTNVIYVPIIRNAQIPHFQYPYQANIPGSYYNLQAPVPIFAENISFSTMESPMYTHQSEQPSEELQMDDPPQAPVSEFPEDTSSSTIESSMFTYQYTEEKFSVISITSLTHSEHDTTDEHKNAVEELMAPEPFNTRPSNLESKQGYSGAPINLITNYITLECPTDGQSFYKYNVTFRPEIENIVSRKTILRLRKETIKPYVFNGNVLYSTIKLEHDWEFALTKYNSNEIVRVKLSYVGEIVPKNPFSVKIYDMIIKHCFKHLQMMQLGYCHFNVKEEKNIENTREIMWPGYITSVQKHENNILIRCEVMYKILRHLPFNNFNPASDSIDRNKYTDIIGAYVITLYTEEVYCIENVDFKKNPSSIMAFNMSYFDYYKNTYEITIRNLNQPLLYARQKLGERSTDKKYVYLVPELCCTIGVTNNIRQNKTLMKNFSKYSRMDAKKRLNEYIKLHQILYSEQAIKEELREWNVALGKELVQFTSRTLSPRKLVFGGNNIISANKTGDWTDNILQKLLHTKRLDNWIIICRQHHQITTFVQNLTNVCSKLSIGVSTPQCHYTDNTNPEAYSNFLEDILERNSPNLIFCIISKSNVGLYQAIKRKCCLDRPVPTQVFLEKNLISRKLDSIITKLAVQINCKLGGAPWHIQYESEKKDEDKTKFMAIGFDTCLDKDDKNNKEKKFLIMVATTNPTLTQFCSFVTEYHNEKEFLSGIDDGISKALKKYYEIENAMLNYIIIYRNGVDEKEIQNVYKNEVKKLEETVKNYNKKNGKDIKIIFIIVTRRIRTILFDRNKEGNPPIGTIVDDVLTNVSKYDFFLVSQHVHAGTISPTSYNIILFDPGLTANDLQNFTYNLTYMYFNSFNTVRIPAVLQYTQKLSQLVVRYLHSPPKEELSDELFFFIIKATSKIANTEACKQSNRKKHHTPVV